MEGSFDAQLQLIREAGFEGFESSIGPSPTELNAIVQANGLRYISQHFVSDPDQLASELEKAQVAGAEKLVVHAGKDWWTFDQGCNFFETALNILGSQSLNVCFETHRGRLMFTPCSTAEYLKRFPELRITADFSHWTTVCESLLDDQGAAVTLAIEHVSHVHARVGHPQGPQVPDPRSPHWSGYVSIFESWWDAILEMHESREEEMTVNPEFGPPDYQWTNPETKAPVANVWDISVWMRDRLKSRWETEI